MHILDNVVWHALTGPHAKYATGTGAARRYKPGFSPIAGFLDAAHPDLDALNGFCAAGEHLYVGAWSGEPSAGWQVDADSTMFQMVWQGPLPVDDGAPDAVLLTTTHAEQAVELAELTRPGPFGPKTIELGEYFGYFVEGRLIAMAGERMHVGSLREVSGVCTHPDFQGRGLARRLMLKLVRRQMMRSETPFLHVMHDNAHAHRLYDQMGFRDRQEMAVRVISPGSVQSDSPRPG